MTDLQRDFLLRYLHERGEMSQGERFGVEWQLLTSSASRKEYSDMERMHLSLSLHFAPPGGVIVPEPRVPWFRVGIAGLTGVVAITSSLLWVEEAERVERLSSAPPVVRSMSYCLQCTVSRMQCEQCAATSVAAALAQAPKLAKSPQLVRSPKPACSPR